MLGDEVHRFCYPDLLHQERSAKAEPLQASLEGVRILAEKPFQYDVVLNYNKLSEMSVGPPFSVLLEDLELSLKFGNNGHQNPLQLSMTR